MKLIQTLLQTINEQTYKTQTIEMPKEAFPNGIFSVEKMPNIQQSIDQIIEKINQFLAKNPNANIEIKIESGESKVSNTNRETTPPTPLKPGELAKLRAQSTANYLKSKLPENITVTILPTNVEANTQKHDYTKGKDDPKDPKYNEDKFVKITIPMTYETCLIDAQINFTYTHTKTPTSCSGNHVCNRATFDVYLLPHKIGTISLNNGNCDTTKENDCNRQASIKIPEDIAIKIAEKGVDSVMLALRCTREKDNLGYCHASAPTISITNQNQTLMEPFCVDEDIPYDAITRISQKRFTFIANFNKCLTKIRTKFNSRNQPNFEGFE